MDLFIAFLEGDLEAREKFPFLYHDKLIKIASRIAPDLAESGLEEDIVQQMWLLLLQTTTTKYDPSRGSVETYLKLLLKTAARDVRAAFVPPGEKTRLQKDENGKFKLQKYPISLDAPLYKSKSGDDVYAEDITADKTDGIKQSDNQLLVDWIINYSIDSKPSIMFEALCQIYYNQLDITKAADIIGVHHSTLRRKIDRWVDENDIRSLI